MKFLVRFFQSPVFEDEDKTLQAQLLNVLILAVFVAIPVLFIGNLLEAMPNPYIYWTSALGIVVAFWLRWLMRRGRVYLASALWVILALGFVTMGILALGTVRATNTSVFLINIAVAGFLLNRRAVFWVTGYSCAAVVLLGWAQNIGWLASDAGIPSMNIVIGFNFLALFTGMAMLMSVSVRMMNRMIRKARSEVAERRKTEQTLRQRDAILEAATFAARKFLQAEDWRKEIAAVLEQFGHATQASHAYIFEKHLLPNGIPALSQRYEWVAVGVKPDMGDPEFENIEIFDTHVDPWLDTLAQGDIYQGNLESLPPPEREFFSSRKVKAIIDAPIMVGGQWWGVIGFDDCFTLRRWSLAEMDAIKIAASTLGAAIQRQSSDEALHQSEARYRNELEQRVEERTHQLAEALREIEDVSYTASHDLRAPVRAINGYANILLRDFVEGLRDVERGYLQKIDRESHRMGNLLDDLIRLIQLNRQVLQIEKVNLSELASKTIEELKRKFPDQQVEVAISGSLIVSGDQTMLQTVMDELLENAWKFMGNQATPCVAIGETPHEGQRTFFVRDNGIGIEMAYAHKLFRNFEQLHQPGIYEGTGMGLAIVQRIIQRHAGKVWVDSAAGEGLAVFFTLGEVEFEGTRGN